MPLYTHDFMYMHPQCKEEPRKSNVKSKFPSSPYVGRSCRCTMSLWWVDVFLQGTG